MNKKQKEREKEEKKNPVHKDYSMFSNMKFVYGTMFRVEKDLKFFIPLGIVMAPVMAYLWTFISKYVLELICEGKSWKVLLPVMIVFTIIQIVSTMLNTFYWTNTWYRYIGARMTMMTRMNRKAMTVDYEHLENPDVLDAFRKAQNSSSNGDSGVEGMMRIGMESLGKIAVVIVGIIIMGTLHPLLIVLLCVTAFLSFLTSDHVNNVTKKTVWDILAPWWRKNNYMNDISTDFKAAKDIRMFHLTDWLLGKMETLNHYRYKMQIKNERNWFFAGLIDAIMWAVSQIGIYGLIIYGVVDGSITIADAYLYVNAAGAFYENINSVLKNVSWLRQRNREVNDFRSFLDFEGGDLDDQTELVPESDHYLIEFQNVSFQYPRAEKYALKNLSLTITPGERLAVVGLNGAGKTTFIKLLLRLYKPTEGKILLNGVDIQSYNKRSYYRLFAPLFQEVELFAFPLSENISMHTPEETDTTRVEECLKMAGMGDAVQKLSHGIQTEVLKTIDDEGVDFSGGEKQKLALSRALYKDAPIVVLDEPTAALDALAEYDLYQSFDKMIGHKSAVYISHRLSSTRFCNHVAMFMDGEMVEYGTHESLLELKGHYAEMFALQAQYYVKEESQSC